MDGGGYSERKVFAHSQSKFFVSVVRTEMDGWMTCNFTSFLTVFQSYQDNVWMIMKGCKAMELRLRLRRFCLEWGSNLVCLTH